MKIYSDERGDMVFSFNEPPFKVEQSFTSTNHKNVLRGIHFSPYKKYITLVSGKIMDVVVSPDGTVQTYQLKSGDSLVINENHGHGYFCYEDSQIIYFLGGRFDPLLEKNCHWKDPTLNIQWPTESVHAIVSSKDRLNSLFKPIETLVLGSNGFLGKQLLKYIPNSIGSSTRLENIDAELKFLKPRYVVSAAGISGKPTVMWCEDHKEETIHVNLTQQLHLIEVCKNLDIHLTIIGSAQVYDGEGFFTEDDKPNFDTLFYSHTRILLENIIRDVYTTHVLYLRVVYPVTFDGNERCFLQKMRNRTHNVHDTRVSLTLVPSLFPKIKTLLDQRVTGIMNFTNDGCVSLRELLDIFDEKYSISNETSDRGECKLDVSRLKNIVNVDDVKSVLKTFSMN
jgi:dTDP-4-dehydrorhamnose 3,5-epimerase-like enzyme/dTDP-4-dehydrorhamnose reductase